MAAFDGRIIMPDEIKRIHKQVLEFQRIEAVPMLGRVLINAQIAAPLFPIVTL